MALGDRLRERREERKQRIRARKELIRIATELYEDEDDAQSLRDKVLVTLEDKYAATDRPWLDFLMKLLDAILPLLLRLLSGLT